MPLRVGILIAGSLDWRSEPYREEWRRSRLAPDCGILVKASTRYGRLSKSGTYTMVFDPACPHGQAKLRSCIHPVSSITDLVQEAAALWTAERRPNAKTLPRRLPSDDWGCVALLANPETAMATLLDDWTERVALEKDRDGRRTYDSVAYTVNGASAICNRGLLQIPWPKRADNGAALDACNLILATATKPTPDPVTKDYPSSDAIAAAWNRSGNAEYFHMNRRYGLYTFQDQEIQSHLKV